MKEVVIITGAGSGMGLATAKYMPKEKVIVIAGRTLSKLEQAENQLKELGFEVYKQACDVSRRESVKELADYAKSFGKIKNVIHCAGISPHMAEGEQIVRINALGTVHMNQEFSKYMERGSVIVDIASNSSYVLPGFLANKKTYALAETDEEAFVKKLVRLSKMGMSDYQKAGFAYALSKNFTVWYAKKCAFEYGQRGIRVCSLSPGLIDTPMGQIEKAEGAFLLPSTCETRMGKEEELGFAIASLADERNGYLAAVDVLVDGGSITRQKEFKWKA